MGKETEQKKVNHYITNRVNTLRILFLKATFIEQKSCRTGSLNVRVDMVTAVTSIAWASKS